MHRLEGNKEAAEARPEGRKRGERDVNIFEVEQDPRLLIGLDG